ncbi:hypothetical protein LSPH24S_09054 [Lysinibacillus sphaericus]
MILADSSSHTAGAARIGRVAKRFIWQTAEMGENPPVMVRLQKHTEGMGQM